MILLIVCNGWLMRNLLCRAQTRLAMGSGHAWLAPLLTILQALTSQAGQVASVS